MSVPGWERILGKRALLSALGPLAGTRATGNVTATATGANVELHPFTYGVPIIDRKAITARMVKTVPTYDAEGDPQPFTVTSGGTAIPVRSVCGGPSGNLPAGTPIIWQPAPTGMLARGAVTAGGITGGVASTGPGSCARVVAFEGLGQDDARRIWEVGGEGLPAIVVSRAGSRAAGGSARGTVRSLQRAHSFTIHVFSAHYSGDDERAEEGELLLDRIEQTLQGLEDVDGDVFSGPGVDLGPEARVSRSPNVHVWVMEATVYYALPAIDARASNGPGDGVSWAPWETTRIEVAAPAAAPLEARSVVDVTVEHEQ